MLQTRPVKRNPASQFSWSLQGSLWTEKWLHKVAWGGCACPPGKWLPAKNRLEPLMKHTFPSRHPQSTETVTTTGRDMLVSSFRQFVHLKWYSWMYTLVGWGLCTMQMYQNSPIYHHIQNAMGTDHHLLGDSAYPLSRTLITPYRDNGHLTPMQKNSTHSTAQLELKLKGHLDCWRGIGKGWSICQWKTSKKS